MLRGDLPSHLPSLESLRIQNCKQLSCCLPRAALLRDLSIEAKHQVEPVVEAITKTQLTRLRSLSISDCSSHIRFPVSAIPALLRDLQIHGCRKLEFQMEDQHHSLQSLFISKSCDSVTSFSLSDAFPNIVSVCIVECEKMESIMVSHSLSCLSSLDIWLCGSLKSLSTLWMAAPQLKQLQIVGCPEIDLFAPGDPHCSLKSLQISYCKKLVSRAALMNSQFHGLTDLRIDGIDGEHDESVKCLPKEGWLPASLESLTL